MKADIPNVLAFLRVVELGSFTRAAKALGHPTSTISRRIARLEAELGVRLLQRTTRTLSLTDAGRVYFERAASAVAALEDAEHELDESQGAPRGLVRVTAPAEMDVSRHGLTGFLLAHPEVRVDLELTNRPVNLIEEGFDVGIFPGRLPDKSSLMARKLFESEFRLVASPAYLERHGTPTTATQLSQHACIAFGSRCTGATWLLEQDGEPLQVPLRVRLAVNHLAAAEEAARAGLGIALLPLLTAGPGLASGELLSILPELSPAPTPIWVVYPGGRHLPPAVRAFVEHLRGSFAELSGSMMRIAQ